MKQLNRRANARLIAAAPEMLEALEMIASAEGEDATEDAWQAVWHAIDKARGRVR